MSAGDSSGARWSAFGIGAPHVLDLLLLLITLLVGSALAFPLLGATLR